RKQALAKHLLNHVIAKYEDQYDLRYLFANNTILDFYPKFGDRKREESSFTVDACSLKRESSNLKKLNPGNKTDFQLISRIVSEKTPLSNILDVRESEDLLM
ncbi:GNAT family N-acetyltransferase, partial [Listeria monocytogenes]